MDTKALHKISYGLYVVGSRLDGKDAGCIVDAFIQSTSAPDPTVILCSIQQNQTNAAIKQTGEFSISVLGTDVDPFVIGNFGFQSGRDADKWAMVPRKRAGELPMLESAASYLRCKVTGMKELATHTVFFCDVVDAWQGEGEPLTYGAYQKDMKAKVAEAFQAHKNGDRIPEGGKMPKSADASSAEGKWVCSICGYVYNGATPFEQLPDDWKCPVCGQPKSVFVRK